MTSQQNEQALPESAEVDDSQEVREIPKASPSRRFSIQWVFAIGLAIVVLGAGYLGFSLWQSINGQLAQLQSKHEILLEQLEKTDRSLSSIQALRTNEVSQWQVTFNELEATVISSAQRSSREANRNQDRWSLEESLTLARLAEQRLHLDKNANVSIGLLTSADTILANLDLAAVLPLRRQIATDVLALQTTPSVDVNGHYFQLDAIGSEIRKLDWLPKPSLQVAIDEHSDLGEGFWQALKQVVVIKKLDVPRQGLALETDFERWQQHVLMLLEQSQLALLASNQTLYDASLHKAEFAFLQMTSQFDVSVWLGHIKQLKNGQLNPQWPDIHASVEVIELYLAEQVKTPETELEGGE